MVSVDLSLFLRWEPRETRWNEIFVQHFSKRVDYSKKQQNMYSNNQILKNYSSLVYVLFQ